MKLMVADQNRQLASEESVPGLGFGPVSAMADVHTLHLCPGCVALCPYGEKKASI